MTSFDKKKYILKLLNINKKGTTIDSIVDYLDYVNKVKYKNEDIEETLKELIFENEIYLKKQFYFKLNTKI